VIVPSLNGSNSLVDVLMCFFRWMTSSIQLCICRDRCNAASHSVGAGKPRVFGL
jgi:hypothetical protein